MEINKHIIDQRITKIVADNPAWFAKIGDERQKKSKAFVIISVSAYLGVEMEEAKNLITEGGNDAGVDAIFNPRSRITDPGQRRNALMILAVTWGEAR